MEIKFRIGEYNASGTFQWNPNFAFEIDNRKGILTISEEKDNSKQFSLTKRKDTDSRLVMEIRKINDIYYYVVNSTGTVNDACNELDKNVSETTPDYLPATINGILKFIGTDDERQLTEPINLEGEILSVEPGTPFSICCFTDKQGYECIELRGDHKKVKY